MLSRNKNSSANRQNTYLVNLFTLLDMLFFVTKSYSNIDIRINTLNVKLIFFSARFNDADLKLRKKVCAWELLNLHSC